MNKNSSKALIAIVIVLLLAVGGGIAYLYFGGYFDKPVPVIGMKGMQKADVDKWIEENEIDPNSVEYVYEYSERIPEDTVIDQSLKEGADFKDEIITVTLSKGKDPEKKFSLPILWKLTKEDLDKWFEMHSFNDVTYEYALDPDHNAGDVLKINQSGYVSRSTPILVTVAADINDESLLVTVPDFKDYNKQQIGAWAQANMITIRYAYDISDNVEAGKVLRQSERAGSQIHPLSEITITISDGKGVALANLVGMTRQEASSWCSENNLKFSYEQEWSETVEAGIVMSMSPRYGNTVTEGSTVSVVVSKGKKPRVTLSGEYIGKPESEFLTYIKSFEDVSLSGSKTSSSYSDKEKGSVTSYDSSKTYYDGDVVYYTTSLGPFTLNAEEYNNKTLKEINSLIDSYKSKGASIAFSYNEVVNDTVAEGKSFDCSADGNLLSCKIAKPTVIIMTNLVGKTLDDAKAWISSNGLTFAGAEEAYNDNYDAGIVYNQSVSEGSSLRLGDNVKLYVSKGPEPVATATIPNIGVLQSICQTSNNYDTTVSTLSSSSVLSSFTNVSYNPVSSDDTPGMVLTIVGQIDGNWIDLSSGATIPVNTPIVITICESYLEN